jgi:hypothetical protein
MKLKKIKFDWKAYILMLLSYFFIPVFLLILINRYYPALNRIAQIIYVIWFGFLVIYFGIIKKKQIISW